jgi:hypothetical protein
MSRSAIVGTMLLALGGISACTPTLLGSGERETICRVVVEDQFDAVDIQANPVANPAGGSLVGAGSAALIALGIVALNPIAVIQGAVGVAGGLGCGAAGAAHPNAETDFRGIVVMADRGALKRALEAEFVCATTRVPERPRGCHRAARHRDPGRKRRPHDGMSDGTAGVLHRCQVASDVGDQPQGARGVHHAMPTGLSEGCRHLVGGRRACPRRGQRRIGQNRPTYRRGTARRGQVVRLQVSARRAGRYRPAVTAKPTSGRGRLLLNQLQRRHRRAAHCPLRLQTPIR